MSREDATLYLKKRRDQRFNTVAFVLYMPGNAGLADTVKNHDGDAPFQVVDGRADPTRPVVTPGPDNDYWDHVDWLVALARQMGLHAILLPAWGSAVVGDYNGKNRGDNVLDEPDAYAYGRWLGARYRGEPHLIWMLGGDRRAVYGADDYRPVFRAWPRASATAPTTTTVATGTPTSAASC